MIATIKDIAVQNGLSHEAIRKRKQKEDWKPIGVKLINHKETEIFEVNELPPDIQCLFLNNDSSEIPNKEKSLNGRLITKTSVVTKISPEAHMSFPFLDSQGRDRPPIAPDSFSEKTKKIALAKMDILKVWEKYQENPIKITEANKEFVRAFNNDLINKDLHAVLGDISWKTLYRWKKQLGNSNDYTRLIDGRSQKNKTGARLNEDEKNTLLNFLLHPAKFDIGTTIRLSKTRLKNIGSPSNKSDRTFRRFAEQYKRKHSDIWTLAREGQKALKDNMVPYIKRDPSRLEVGDVLVADGHRLNFQVINPFTGKPCRAVLVGFLDWKSYNLAGYEIMIEENVQCIVSALRNSIICLGKFPRIAYQDNGKAFKARFFTSTENLEEAGIYGLFGRLGIVPVFAQPYNARSKIIERWFRDFINTFERLLPSFIGTSIKDKPAWMIRNEKFHEALHKTLHGEYIPKIEEIIQLIEIWREFHRSQPCPHVEGKTIGKVFDEGRGPGVDISELDDLMLAIKISKIGRNGIRFLNSDYYNESFYGLRENVIIKYSLFDLSFIKVYTLKGEFLCAAQRVMAVHPMANYFGEPKDIEELNQAISLQRRLISQTVQGVKGLIKSRKSTGINMLPWQEIINVAPKIVDKLEKENVIIPLGSENKITSDKFSSLSEAMKEFMSYLPGIFLSPEDREIIEKEIEANDLNKAFVENFGLEVRAQLAKREIYEEKQQRNTAPVFESGQERYEYLKKKLQLTDKEQQFVRDYEQGIFSPGEYDAFEDLRQQDGYLKKEAL